MKYIFFLLLIFLCGNAYAREKTKSNNRVTAVTAHYATWNKLSPNENYVCDCVIIGASFNSDINSIRLADPKKGIFTQPIFLSVAVPKTMITSVKNYTDRRRCGDSGLTIGFNNYCGAEIYFRVSNSGRNLLYDIKFNGRDQSFGGNLARAVGNLFGF